jgi:hypothetical protein
MKNEIEQQIFKKMKAKDFGESMCNETKLNVLRWTMRQLPFPMAQDKKKQESIKRLEKLLYYFPYMSENILLRDQIIEIYNLLSDQEYAKD